MNKNNIVDKVYLALELTRLWNIKEASRETWCAARYRQSETERDRGVKQDDTAMSIGYYQPQHHWKWGRETEGDQRWVAGVLN